MIILMVWDYFSSYEVLSMTSKRRIQITIVVLKPTGETCRGLLGSHTYKQVVKCLTI